MLVDWKMLPLLPVKEGWMGVFSCTSCSLFPFTWLCLERLCHLVHWLSVTGETRPICFHWQRMQQHHHKPPSMHLFKPVFMQDLFIVFSLFLVFLVLSSLCFLSFIVEFAPNMWKLYLFISLSSFTLIIAVKPCVFTSLLSSCSVVSSLVLLLLPHLFSLCWCSAIWEGSALSFSFFVPPLPPSISTVTPPSHTHPHPRSPLFVCVETDGFRQASSYQATAYMLIGSIPASLFSLWNLHGG